MQVKTVAGQLAGQIGAADRADPRLPDVEPSGVGAVCAAVVSSYLRIDGSQHPEGVPQNSLMICSITEHPTESIQQSHFLLSLLASSLEASMVQMPLVHTRLSLPPW